MVMRLFVFAIIFSGSFLLRGQEVEYKDVKKLPSTINSSAEEGMPLLSPDGKKLYFTRALYSGNEGGEFGGQDIWISEHSGHTWRKAQNDLRYINNRNNNVVIGLSADGKTMYYVDGSRSSKMGGIHFTTFTNNNWSRPQFIPIPGIDNLDFIGMFVSPDADVIFISMKAPDARGEEDLYYSIKDKTGLWIKPRSLGATINTTGFEISPYLSPDKKRLYFSSNGHPGLGDADIFYSEKVYESWETWSVPVNLGPVVNSKGFDAYFSTYGDSIAYFCSNRDGNMADIYQATIFESKSILNPGQHYVTTEEWNTMIGKNVSASFAFPHQSALLSSSQKELLFYIVNKLLLQKEIQFHLVVKEEEDEKLSGERLAVIREELKKLGVDQSRIRVEQIFSKEKTQRGVVEIRLFR
jgi:hypothetical protein